MSQEQTLAGIRVNAQICLVWAGCESVDRASTGVHSGGIARVLPGPCITECNAPIEVARFLSPTLPAVDSVRCGCSGCR